MKLSNGVVIPSYLGTRSCGLDEGSGFLTNDLLRMGEVKEIIWPSSERSLSKRFVEYAVEVQHRDGSEAGVSARYENCLLANIFGGIGDICRWTLRPDVRQCGDETGMGVGSKVLLLCVNGETTRNYIIGGVRDPLSSDDALNDKEADGHHWLWEFNGIRQSINQYGEFSILFRGATEFDGTAAKNVTLSNSGAKLSFLKDGAVGLNDGNEGEEKLELDLQNSQVRLYSGGTAIINAPDKISAITNKTINLEAGVGVKIGASNASQALVRGTDWRLAEAKKDVQIAGAISTMIALLGALTGLQATAGAGLAAAAAAHAVPISGPIVGAPAIASAGAAITSMAPIVAGLSGAMSNVLAAITEYETNGIKYLSTKNSTDG